ncbi:MAG TPA: bifunctional oligoribonuclease/PAP phosphatase NrnA [Egicoccus sp.]|nr:bifunctional oligoribonuclease/PAP phosphatase NrnA [Egicoccus sp.]HSK22656.1 bifunctional oligoribonuclease/PAP phosphatase NrnA [Egicoccus sp.]
MSRHPAPAWLDDLDPAVLDEAVRRMATCAHDGGRVVLAAHVGPDGDALGAALALHVALSGLGARTVPTVGEEPLKVPASLADLPGVRDLVTPSSLPAAADVDLLVTLDAATPERLGSVSKLLDEGVPTIVVDHHASSTAFGDLRLVAPNAAATVLIVDELLHRLEVPLTAELATCLYVGLVTDTGRFGHASTDRAAMEFGGRLLEVGVEHAELTRRLYGTSSLGELRLLGRALDRLTFVPDVSLVHTHLTADELTVTGASLEATESVIDVVRTADVAEVALVCKPAPDGTWRASLRSHGRVDVGAIAEALGGGGHAFASGFSAAGAVDDVVASVVDALRSGWAPGAEKGA